MIILDNSVISAFCEIGRFELLHRILLKLDLQAMIPTTVLKEMIFDESLAVVTTGNTDEKKWIKVVPVDGYSAYLKTLHSGEAGVIALAKQVNATVVLDDLDARKVAKKENIKLTGTLGLIKIGYELCPVKDKQELQIIINELQSVYFSMSDDLENEIMDTKKIGSILKAK